MSGLNTKKGNAVVNEARVSSHDRHARRAPVLVCALLAAFVGSALMVSTAAAARTQIGEVAPFTQVQGAAIDNLGNVWAADARGIYKFNAFPSQTLLTSDAYSGSPKLQLAVEHETDNVFVANGNGRTLKIFDEDGTLLETWSGINGVRAGAAASGPFHVAIDNTSSYSRGRVYLSLATPENDVEALDADQRPVEFPATAPYIEGNRITGTPSGKFGEVYFVAVDADGNIYVTDVKNEEVDEFSSTGEFVHSFPAPGAESGAVSNPGHGGPAVDPTDGTLLIAEGGSVKEFDPAGNLIGTISSFGQGTPVVDSAGRAYVPAGSQLKIYGPNPQLPTIDYEPVSGETTTAGTVNATIDPGGGGAVTSCKVEYGTSTGYSLGATPCSPDPGS